MGAHKLLTSLLAAVILTACGSAAPAISAPVSARPPTPNFSPKLVISESVGQDTVETLAFSPDGKRLAIGAGDGTVAVYPLQPAPGEVPVAQKLHGGLVSSLAWSPDGSKLLTAAVDGSVRFSDSQTLQPVRSFNALQGTHPAAVFSPDASQIALAQGKGTVQILNEADGSLAASYNLAGITRALLWLPSGEIAAGDDAGQVVFFKQGAQPRVFQPSTPHKAVNSLSLSPDGTLLAAGYDDGAILLIDPATSALVRELPQGRQVGTLAWAPNGKVLAVSSVAFDLKFLDSSGKQLAVENIGYDVNGTAWSADGQYAAAAADDHTFKIWQIRPPQTPSRALASTPPSYMGR